MSRHASPLAPAEAHPASSTAGSVIAEIGDDRGAVIVHVPAEWVGVEIEVRRPTEPWNGTHVAVMERHLACGMDYSAFFPSLSSGEHEVRMMSGPESLRRHAEVRSVMVAAGSVTDLGWYPKEGTNESDEEGIAT